MYLHTSLEHDLSTSYTASTVSRHPLETSDKLDIVPHHQTWLRETPGSTLYHLLIQLK